ncbi:MAG: DNA methyltransferase [Candidatus Coatesbacteria bacterium]
MKTYLEQIRKGKVPVSYWADDDFAPVQLDSTSWGFRESGRSSDGVSELAAIVGAHTFETVKPLKLFQKILHLWCPADGLVLDPFAGSGTAGHAVLLANHTGSTARRFILIEQGRPDNGDSYARTLLADRLRRVATGEWSNGKGKPTRGGYSFLALGKKVDATALLRMERDEMVDTVIASHFDATRRRGDQLVRIEASGTKAYRYLVARNAENEGFFLVWDGADKNTDFTEAAYEVCVDEASRAGLRPAPYHVYARLYRYQTEGVKFYQIPDRILADFGLDLKSEPFVDDDNELA